MALILILQSCPHSPQLLLIREKDAVAMGMLEQCFLPSAGTSLFGNPMGAKGFGPSKLHLYPEPPYSHVIIEVG